MLCSYERVWVGWVFVELISIMHKSLATVFDKHSLPYKTADKKTFLLFRRSKYSAILSKIPTG